MVAMRSLLVVNVGIQATFEKERDAPSDLQPGSQQL
jgi:hypothetical protein